MDVALERSYHGPDAGGEEFIDRPDARKLFEKVVSSPPSEYGVSFGAHGTGKSTLAREVACKTQDAIYVIVPPVTGNSSFFYFFIISS